MHPRYAELLPIIRSVARAFGYAIGVHGSGARDLDLIAVPWVNDAVAPEEFVEALRLAVDGHVGQEPVVRPHGRRGWIIRLLTNNPDATLHIDLSITPWQQAGDERARDDAAFRAAVLEYATRED